MARGPTFWIVSLAVAAAAAGLWVEHRRLHPPPPQGVTVADVGDLAADATFLSLDGKARRLSDWRGKRVLLNFWASWCAPCRREMPLLSQAYDRHRGRGVAVVGVAEDTAAGVRGYLADSPVDYPVVIVDADAPGGSLSFGNTLRVLPYSVLIGEDGRIQRRKIGTFTAPELDDWLGP
ncbi:TlpA family protein disulfide reductase [Luteibacter aegosomatis]|uniref:TlpA family protein disulfide reductase n=1 Tax=Luteibacter aegosomatis TaxID=2911537 RepID=UPI001FF78DBE|nr:TlpA disulfide reductase family protein [Luteibacter aegosomatis]UPG85278.1 TlpA family protein disulfide reductase [Luteibacter aegosomatis]